MEGLGAGVEVTRRVIVPGRMARVCATSCVPSKRPTPVQRTSGSAQLSPHARPQRRPARGRGARAAFEACRARSTMRERQRPWRATTLRCFTTAGA